jgi:hypothetical protein
MIMVKHSDTIYIDSDEFPTYSKLEIAEHQLERALDLYFSESDFICAITLAGASEEILRWLLENIGKKSMLDSLAESVVSYGKIIYGEEWNKKEIVSDANYYKDHLKHIKGGEGISITKEAAEEILDRAITNYWNLTGRQTENMKRFCES